MRILALVLLAGCFDPSPKPGQACIDWCPPPESCVASVCRMIDEETRPNYMFLTSDVRPIAAQNATSLDTWCNERAVDARLPGTYVAWFSTDVSAASKFGSLKNSTRGWIRLDGKPFADTVDDIIAGKLYYPPRISDAGTDELARSDVDVVTGTNKNGLAQDTCNNLSGTESAFVTVGRADAGFESWTHAATATCNIGARIYCFGKDRNIAVARPVIPPGGKRVFVTRNPYPLGIPSDADIRCRAEGGPTFVALLATAAQSVKERFAESTGPWYRVDGVLVTEDMTELTAPIDVNIDGAHTKSEVWFGATSLTESGLSTHSCTNWTSTGGSVRTGFSERSIGAGPFSTQNGNCGAEYRYYCAEL